PSIAVSSTSPLLARLKAMSDATSPEKPRPCQPAVVRTLAVSVHVLPPSYERSMYSCWPAMTLFGLRGSIATASAVGAEPHGTSGFVACDATRVHVDPPSVERKIASDGYPLSA